MFEALTQRLEESFTEVWAQLLQQVVERAPRMLLAIVLLLLGFVLAHVVKVLLYRLFDFIALDKLAAKVNVDRALHAFGVQSGLSRILSLLIGWLIVLVALFFVSELLALRALSDAIGVIVAYFPNLIAGLLLLIIGLLVGRFLRDILSTSLARAGFTASELIGLVAQGVFVIFVCLLALRQVGFDVSIITTNLAVIIGVLLVSSGLAVALAVRPILENYFACRQLQGVLRTGDKIRTEEVQGTVIAFTRTSVIVREGGSSGEAGTVSEIVLPARELFERRFWRARHP